MSGKVKSSTAKTVKMPATDSAKIMTGIKARIDNFKSRRPHRSFVLTRRRDYARSLALPGYLRFSTQVFKALSARRRVWLCVGAIYAVLAMLLGGFTSQETYRTIGSVLEQSASQLVDGDVGQLSQAGLLAIASFSGGTANVGEAQQVYLGLLAILTWLTTVWLLREQLGGQKPTVRDGIYSSASPLVPTFLVSLVLVAQLLPIALLAFVYTALSASGLISQGFGAFISFAVVVLVLALTLYWLTATFISLVVVTLPGMYPIQALKAGGDLVVGRRLRIMYRMLWLSLLASLFWLVLVIPTILIDRWLGRLWEFWSYVPLVPVVVAAASSFLVIYCASYIYLLYRKVVADDASPA